MSDNPFEGKVVDRISCSWGEVTIFFKDGSKAVSQEAYHPAQEGQLAYTQLYFKLVEPRRPK